MSQMSNNRNLSMGPEEIPSLYYEENFGADSPVGQLTIWGLNLPYNPKFNPLDKIWSSVRKRIAEEYDIQITGVFRIEPKEKKIIGTFMLNMASVDESNFDVLQFRFRELFQIMMINFETVLETWTMNDNGLAAYKSYVEEAEYAELERCNEILDEFLISAGVKTPKDLKEREKKKKELKKHRAFIDLFRKFASESENEPSSE